MLEKDKFVQGKSKPQVSEEDVLCAICNYNPPKTSEDDGDSAIIFCEICGISVHQQCYGANVGPEKEW